MAVNVNRRAALCLISATVTAAGAIAQLDNAPANTAAARLGARLANERGTPFAVGLAREAPDPANIAHEYRQGHTILISGIMYSRSEAAAFSRAALEAGLVSA